MKIMDAISSYNQALFAPWAIIWGIIKFIWKLVTLILILLAGIVVFFFVRIRRLIYHLRNKSNTSSLPEQTLAQD